VPIEKKAGNLQKVWKTVGAGFGCIGLAGLMWTFSLWDQQLNTLPHVANAVIGQIYPRNIHGIVVYQTFAQRNHLDTVQFGSFAIFGVSIVMSLIYRSKWGK
jgi:hypothetical protein